MIVVLTISLMSVLAFQFYNTDKIKYDKLYLNETATSLNPINTANMTSLVFNTEEHGNQSIIHLSNGINIQTTDKTIKSGDSLSLRMLILKPICSLNISTENSIVNTNNTLVYAYWYKSEECKDGYELMKLLDWNKLNQK